MPGDLTRRAGAGQALAVRCHCGRSGEVPSNTLPTARLRCQSCGARSTLGELLAEMKERGQRDGQGGDKKSKLHDATLKTPTLSDIGVTRTQSVPEQIFAEYGRPALNDSVRDLWVRS
jgi:hypothetical protein